MPVDIKKLPNIRYGRYIETEKKEKDDIKSKKTFKHLDDILDNKFLDLYFK
tara:strand:- start:49700 stop:49852 length:153 start_codon:yes stop_codon:yes gene_type:complete